MPEKRTTFPFLRAKRAMKSLSSIRIKKLILFLLQIKEILHLDTIKLTNFKNYESANLTFSPQLNAFVGLNGTGKTNLLDAIYYACMCKSYFLPLDADVILRGADFLRVDALFQKNGKRERIVAKTQAKKRKIFERNDVAYSALSDHIGLLPVVMIAPDDTDLIKEGSEERRRFVDNALSQLDNLYLRHLMFYNKIVEQRNAALKKWGENSGYTEGVQSNWLQLIETYDSQLVPSAQYIFEKRQEFVADFEPIFNFFYKKISDERETVSIVYESQLLKENLTDILLRNREKDRYLQRTSAGIHKDNLGFAMNEKPLRKFGSQGQLKSFVISLKLAQYHILRTKNSAIKTSNSLEINAKNEPQYQTDLALRNNLDLNSSLELEDIIESNQPINSDIELENNVRLALDLTLNNELNAHNELELRTELDIEKELKWTDKVSLNFVELENKPLLLLDDIFDKLDAQRVQNLLQLIVSQQFGQIFITDTHIERIEKLGRDLRIDFKKFEINNGVVKTL
ncbi:MAG: DNA replication and repair protein RecF [Saprospiraceae bacterium]|nr:DNA replication and repair protein RecF [Saprospiraceae bacterium]